MDSQDTSIFKNFFTDIAEGNGNVLGAPDGELSYAYVRVSSSGQAEEGRSGLPRQLANVHEKACALNLRIPYELVYWDDHSGFEFRSRPGLQLLLSEVDRPERAAHHLVIEYLDRLSRNAKWHQGFLLDLFKDHRITVHFWKSFGSEIERAVMGAISEEGMRHEIERMVRGTRHKAQSGRITAKKRSYGYLFADSQGRSSDDPNSNYRKDTRYVIHPGEAPIVAEIFRRIIAGDSLYTICDDLSRRGVPTPKGSRCWETGNVSKMLKNPIYRGEYAANRHYFNKEWSERAQKMVLRQRLHPEDEWIIVPVPAIVSAEMWQEAQEALQRNYKLSTRNTKEPSLLQGLLYCARCGEQVGAASTSRYKDKEKIRFYLCFSYYLPPILRERLCCQSPYVRAADIEPYVWNAVCKVVTNPDLIIQYLEQQTEQVIKGGLTDQLAYVEREIMKCEREENQWDRAFAAEIFGIQEYKDKKSAVTRRKDALLEERERLDAEVREAMEFEQKKELIRQHLETIVLSGALDDTIPLKDKRRVLGLLVDKIVIDTEKRWFTLEGVIRGSFPYGSDLEPAGDSDNFAYTSGAKYIRKTLVPFVFRFCYVPGQHPSTVSIIPSESSEFSTLST